MDILRYPDGNDSARRHPMKRKEYSIETNGRGFTDLTARTAAFVRESGVRDGVCNVFLVHTSASLIFGENADPSASASPRTAPPRGPKSLDSSLSSGHHNP